MMVVGLLVSERAALTLLSLDSSKDNSCCLTSDKMSSRSDPVSVR